MAVFQTAERMLPSALRTALSPYLRKLAALFAGQDEKAASQRMALIAFTIRIAGAALAFLSQIILARLMGRFEYGVFVFVWVLMILFGNLACLGFPTAIIRFLPQYDASGNHDAIRGLNATARLFVVAVSGTLALIGAFLIYVFRGMIEDYYILPIFLGLIAVPMIALGDVLDGTARAKHWPVMALSPTFLIRPTLILLFMVAAVLAGAPRDAVTAMTAALAGAFTSVLLQYLVVTLRLRRHYPGGPKATEFNAWFAVAFPIFLVEGVGYLLTNSDVVVVGIFLDPDQVAVYFAAAKTMALVHFVYFAVKAAIGPRFAAILAEGDRSKLAAFAADATRWTFFPALAVGLAVLAAGQFLLSLFGAAFTDGQIVMAILLAGILARALVGPAEVLLTMADKQMLCVYLYAAALVTNIGLNAILIPHLGIEGAAIAGAAAMAVEALLLHIAVRHALGITLFALIRRPATPPATRAL
ncbi:MULTISPECIES: lipopolysaccharide biosynthesis protein [unclassified Rhizobium]|uniref:oligosaccharide flippase family protein n=1 Tax=unclassified Rhizobium TaxID=2613769 RepID=UPI000EA8634B|nr:MULTISPECIES: lipopolysaccharide biosynthesis protein [unclassified Rhizobium]AYG67532.1 lipopolysaccharide biosynthesis protein [Rhizobium sp. CCGE531]AYG73926.1 lipopolysaccharide biosynthesis protein [Rhizobium sp. CCGE532]